MFVGLGTYVGSCLGIGGIYTDSAAAIVLDVNKQVVFARNRAGHFLARQVVALTDDDQLACYGVYPDATSPALQGLFRDFDRQLARALEVLVFHPDELDDATEPRIENLVSSYWWDDGVWDLVVEENPDGSTGADSPGKA